jgi:hypothetical protein
VAEQRGDGFEAHPAVETGAVRYSKGVECIL